MQEFLNAYSPLHGNRTAISEAVVRKHKESFLALVGLGANPAHCDASGQAASAAQYAAAVGWGDPGMMGLLELSQGGPPTTWQSAPLMVAVVLDQADFVCKLCSERGIDLNITDKSGNTALHYAAMIRRQK